MTKKDFEVIAKAVNEFGRFANTVSDQYISTHYLVEDLAKYFKGKNPAFDKGKFVEACKEWEDA